MNEQVPSPEESMQLISQMINKAQNRFNENGHLYLLWGWVIVICSGASFLSVYLKGTFHYLPYIWMLTWVTFIYQSIYLYRKRKNETVKTYLSEINGQVWLVFVITGALFGFLMYQKGDPELLNTAILILYGVPTFLSGVIMQFTPLKTGAFICWLLAILSIFIPAHFSFLLIMIAVVSAWIIPGYLLRSRFKNQH